jgi:hypothetical protein
MKYLLVGLRWAAIALPFSIVGFVALELLGRTQFHWALKAALALLTAAFLIGAVHISVWLAFPWLAAPLN